MNVPTIYKGKDYSNAIEHAIHRAEKEFLYPSSSYHLGMKNLFGQKFYADLIADELYHTNIPISLKIKLMGKKKYILLKKK